MATGSDADDARNRAARYRAGIDPADEAEDETPRPRQRRPEDQTLWVDQQVRQAIARGEFDDLPLAGKPLPRSAYTRDPDWWVKQLIERERITGVLPPALALRTEDAELDDLLDTTGSPERARELVEEFNARVVEARRQLQGGPPVVTPTRDVDVELERWHERRRLRALARQVAPAPPPRRWWRRRG